MTSSFLIKAVLGTEPEPATPSEGLRLRLMQPDDIATLAARMAAMEPWRGLGYDSALLEAYLRRPDPGLARLTLTAEGAVSGLLCVRPRWLRGAFLELLCLFPDIQGKGHGTHLMRWLMADASQLGPNFWTSCTDSNLAALAFYRQLGFEPCATLADLLRTGEDEVLLRCSLEKS